MVTLAIAIVGMQSVQYSGYIMNTLSFVLQNELSILEFIHTVVETFDRYFESVVSGFLC